MANELLGDDLYLFYDANSNFSAPTGWNTPQTSFGDMTFNPNNEQVEIPKRIAFKTYKKGRADWELTFNMNYDKTNAWHLAVRSAIELGTKIHMAFGDSNNLAAVNTHYWHAMWFLSGSFSGSLDEVASVDVTGKIHHDTGTADSDLPAAVTV